MQAIILHIIAALVLLIVIWNQAGKNGKGRFRWSVTGACVFLLYSTVISSIILWIWLKFIPLLQGETTTGENVLLPWLGVFSSNLDIPLSTFLLSNIVSLYFATLALNRSLPFPAGHIPKLEWIATHWLFRLFLANIFLYTGYIKLDQPLQFAATLSGYQLIPDQYLLPIAYSFPWLEIILGEAILIGWKIRYCVAGATALLLFFSLLLTITYLRGIDANCGCFSFDDPISPLTILRDGIIVIPAIYLLLEKRIRRRFEKQ